ncbi:sodium-dependent transporter [Halocatena pleomorpha]|uniref:Transporter n=1 Tax=Halocatena pleomorpha TaxID=1785090 RepID=A0A3P3RAS0_9EURY|nr:sodium-dependent transporter [Halocatena pleomorpha]RRJ30494.1 sodium-dependent transporter [Halocatena pleomorpha]
MVERETWTTRIGFILAAVGSAVGLGNIWRFPFSVAESGGGAFLVVYLIAILIVGIPALLAEFVIGRRANVDAVGAFRAIGRGNWRFIGAIGVLASFWTLSYYSVIGGWVLRYIFGSATGSALAGPEAYFGAASAGSSSVLTHVLFMAITIGIVAFGIERGIELATKFMVPSIVVLLLGLAVYAFMLPDAAPGYEFLFDPNVTAITSNLTQIIPAATGQALFSLSVGFSVMITYASYLGKDDSLGADGLSIAVTNTFVGILAGTVVLPLLFAGGLSVGAAEGGGIGAVFVAIPIALGNFPPLIGKILGIVFFFVVLIAALSSAISLLEAPVAYVVDEFGVPRMQATLGIGGGAFVLGVPSAWDIAWLSWFDGIGVALLLPTTVLFVVIFVGWIMGDDAVDEIKKGMAGDSFGTVWLWSLRTFVLVVVVVVFLLNIHDLFFTLEKGTSIVPPLLL